MNTINIYMCGTRVTLIVRAHTSLEVTELLTNAGVHLENCQEGTKVDD